MQNEEIKKTPESEEIEDKTEDIKANEVEDIRTNEAEDVQEKDAAPKTGTGVIVLITCLALICGVAVGWFCGARFSGTAKELKKAQAQIDEYETALLEMYSEAVEIETQDDAGDPIDAPVDNGQVFADLAGLTSDGDESVVAVEFAGGAIMSDEAEAACEEALSEYIMAGMDVPEDLNSVYLDVLAQLAGEKIAAQKAQEMGLTSLSEDDMKRIDEIAQSEYHDTLHIYASTVMEEGGDHDAAEQAAAEMLEEEGYTLESVKDEIAQYYWFEKLYDSVTSDVSVDPVAITAAYNDRCAAQKAEFDADRSAFEYALFTGELILYYPEGYRLVKLLSFDVDDEAYIQLLDLEEQLETASDDDKPAIEAQIDALYADAAAQADAAYSRVIGGESFDDLLSQLDSSYGEDGWYVSEDSDMWPQEFVDAAMALALPGDVSEPVKADGTVYIIRYISNVEPGSVPLSTISAQMTADTLEESKDAKFEEQLNAWINEADVTYYPERLFD